MQVSWTRLPFRFRNLEEYEARLNGTLSSLFYEMLPVAGYQVREEQVYTAFRIAKAMVAGKVLLAEAGLGTGKTLAYLGAAVCHARLRGAPVVVASATAVLQQQVVDPTGDLAALDRVLGLKVDTRLARHPGEYLCEVKVDEVRRFGGQKKGLTKLLKWAGESQAGVRAEVAGAPDDLWKLVAWEEGLPCDTCPRRGFCRLTRAREHYRAAADLIICDHDFFFRDLWSRRERREAGLQPLLPAYSGVVFDEGHDVPEVAQRAAGYSLRYGVLRESMIEATRHNDRMGLVRSARAAAEALQKFWMQVEAELVPGEEIRRHVTRSRVLAEMAGTLRRAIGELQDELVTEEAMFEETEIEVRVRAMQARFDQAVRALDMLLQDEERTVIWAEAGAGGRHDLWVVPRRLGRMLKRELYDLGLPVIFSSATLASGDSFDYFKRVVGAPDALTAQVGTPFNLEEQALVYWPEPGRAGAAGPEPGRAGAARVEGLVGLLEATRGRALVLVNTGTELAALRAALAGRDLPWRIVWEGDGERAELLRRFAAEVESVLVGTSYWEGIDVPGESLSAVVVLQLPFPPHDPVMTARREEAAAAGLDPHLAVDVPAMAVRLKQGRGRLIRAETDRGVFGLLDTSFLGTPHEDAVRGALPEGAPVTNDLDRVRTFLTSS